MTLVLLNNDETNVIRRVPQGEARREQVLRDLIAERPEILPVHDLDPSYGRLVIVTREFSNPRRRLCRCAADRCARPVGGGRVQAMA